MRHGLSLLGIIAALLGALGCNSDDESGSASRPSVPQVKADRPELAFFATHGSAIYDLGIADDRGQHRQILTGESKSGTVFPQLFTGLSWSPDGEAIAFAGVKGRQTDAHAEPTDIFAISTEKPDAEQISDVGDAGDPLWSPDGETIVFTRSGGAEGEPIRGSLWSIQVDGSGLTELVEAGDWEVYKPDSFTPDGSQLVVTKWTIDPESAAVTSEIDAMSPDGSDQEQLIEQASDGVFSPDGTQIAFASDRDHNGELCYGDRCFFGGELYLADSDGSDAQRLTETNALNEAHPSWLPDGSRIAYQRGEAFENAEAITILEANPDGSCAREILGGSGAGAWYASPAWRPSEPRAGGGALSC